MNQTEKKSEQQKTQIQPNTISCNKLRVPPVLKQSDWKITNQIKTGQLTQFFNYGFNEYLMRCYINKLKYIKESFTDNDRRKDYSINVNKLSKMNDEIPMDLGGLGNFLDPELLQNELLANLYSQHLLRIFLRAYDKGGLRSMIQGINTSPQSNPNDPFLKIIENLQKNIDQKNREFLQQTSHNVFQHLYAINTVLPSTKKSLPEPDLRERRSLDKQKKKEKKEKKGKKEKKAKREKKEKKEKKEKRERRESSRQDRDESDSDSQDRQIKHKKSKKDKIKKESDRERKKDKDKREKKERKHSRQRSMDRDRPRKDKVRQRNQSPQYEGQRKRHRSREGNKRKINGLEDKICNLFNDL